MAALEEATWCTMMAVMQSWCRPGEQSECAIQGSAGKERRLHTIAAFVMSPAGLLWSNSSLSSASSSAAGDHG
jgi:hypothetical protein